MKRTIAGLALCFFAIGGSVSAAPGDVVQREVPCYGAGWAPGDRWGPDIDDRISRRARPCPTPTPTIEIDVPLVGTPAPTLPATDTGS